MRKIILVSAMLLPLAVMFNAEVFSRVPEEITVTGFKAVLDDGRVVATWKRYKRTDFSSYALVKSSTKDSPVYPDDAAIFTSDDAGSLRFEDGKISPGVWHYRLCIMTHFGDRWVSPVVTVNIGVDDLKRSLPTAADFE